MTEGFRNYIKKLYEEGVIPQKQLKLLEQFYASYLEAAQESDHLEKEMLHFLELLKQEFQHPYSFEPYHKRVTAPTNYTTFAMNLFRPLIDFSSSKVEGLENLAEIVKATEEGESVILLANHQVEPDPQVIQLLLEKSYPEFGKEIIFVAGQRVTTDPLAIPFSMGCNLLCIYSKKYIEQPPEQKEEKLLHNQKTMKQMGQLLSEGGKCIYVAPSGGRDRKGASGKIEVAPFDPSSIEMFRLMAMQADKKTRFFPLALSTYHILPPPESIQTELGEKREAKKSPAHLWFGPEIDMDNFPGSDNPDKKLRRQHRADYIWKIVNDAYEKFLR